MDSFADDDGELVRERRVVSDEVGNGKREDVAVAVLVLEPLSGERPRPPR
jgi:hypothetical protein